MMNHGKLFAVLVSFGVLISTPAWSQTTLEDGTGTVTRYDDQMSSTDKAFVLNLATDDIEALRSYIMAGFLADPISGRTDEIIWRDLGFTDVGIEGLSYSFTISDLTLTPKYDRIEVTADISHMEANIETLWLNQSGSMYCENLPLDSGNGMIPVDTNVMARTADRELNIFLNQQNVHLNSDNFYAYNAEYCDTIWGFNWLVRRVLPWVIELAKQQIAAAIEEKMQEVTAGLADEFGNILNANITWPFDLPGLPKFYGSIYLWPASLGITENGIRMKLGSDVNLDPDPVPEVALEGSTLWGDSGLGLPSYLGIGYPLVAALLHEANVKGVFRLDVNNQTMPVGELLRAGTLARIIPDAAERFAADAELNLGYGQAEATEVTTVAGEHGISINLVMKSAAVKISVDDVPYYSLRSNLTIPLLLGIDKANKKIKFGVKRLQQEFVSGSFDPTLSPAPTDIRFLNDEYQVVMKEFNDRVLGPGMILSFDLPDLQLGEYTMEFVGASLRDEYVTIDASLE